MCVCTRVNDSVSTLMIAHNGCMPLFGQHCGVKKLKINIVGVLLQWREQKKVLPQCKGVDTGGGGGGWGRSLHKFLVPRCPPHTHHANIYCFYAFVNVCAPTKTIVLYAKIMLINYHANFIFFLICVSAFVLFLPPPPPEKVMKGQKAL